ncbi:MAG: hypothetical protein MHM6MM_007709, partial [Cercozoa sp. M6MM]
SRREAERAKGVLAKRAIRRSRRTGAAKLENDDSDEEVIDRLEVRWAKGGVGFASTQFDRDTGRALVAQRDIDALGLFREDVTDFDSNRADEELLRAQPARIRPPLTSPTAADAD